MAKEARKKRRVDDKQRNDGKVKEGVERLR
jgi:hypothetical protein